MIDGEPVDQVCKRGATLCRPLLSYSPSIMILFRIGALVPLHGQVVKVLNRFVKNEGTLYVIHTKAPDRTLRQNNQVSFGQIVAAMNEYARFCVGDKLELGPAERYVKARWWSCTRGTVIYRVGDGKENGKSWIVGQEELMERAKRHEIESV